MLTPWRKNSLHSDDESHHQIWSQVVMWQASTCRGEGVDSHGSIGRRVHILLGGV